MKGKVKFFNNANNFGFLIGEDGTEYFVHKSGLKEGVVLNDEDPVEFETEQTERGPKAVNVQKSDGAAPAAEPEDSNEDSDDSDEDFSDDDDSEESKE